MIILCPSCNTKFAVDAGQLADVENPRFHCSRCDHFFEALELKPKDEPSDARSFQLDLLDDEPEISAASSAGVAPIPAPANSASPVYVPQAETSSNTARRIGLPSGVDIDDNPVVYASWPQDRPGQAFEADLRSVHARLLQVPTAPQPAAKPTAPAAASQSAALEEIDADNLDEVEFERDELEESALEADELPTEEHDAVDSEEELVEDSIEDDDESELEDEIAQFERTIPGPAADFTSPPAVAPVVAPVVAPTAAPVRSESPRISTFGAWASSRSAEVSTPEEGAEPEYLSETYRSADPGPRAEDIWRESKRSTVRPRRDRRVFSARRLSLPFAGSVPFLMMLCIWYWSTHLGQTPQAIRNMFYLDPVGLPQLAPAGLEVTDLQSSFVTLDDGSRVLEIRGSIFNASTRTFGKVKLEAKIFDEKNKELGRLIVDPHTSLADAKIQALSARALAELQAEPANAFVRLNPNERVPFRIVFTELGAPEAQANVQWFSARIYSIEPQIS